MLQIEKALPLRVVAAKVRRLAVLTLVGFLALSTQSAVAVDPSQLIETRYCGEPKRGLDGRILRSSAVTAEFQRLHPCPSTKLTYGSCPGWKKDHVISLGAKHPVLGGGCDSVSNMQWLPDVIKLCTEWYCKDRWELDVYALPGVVR